MSNKENMGAKARLAGETVSVVIPCYNTHEFLAMTLDSVRAQTFPVEAVSYTHLAIGRQTPYRSFNRHRARAVAGVPCGRVDR